MLGFISAFAFSLIEYNWNETILNKTGDVTFSLLNKSYRKCHTVIHNIIIYKFIHLININHLLVSIYTSINKNLTNFICYMSNKVN